MKADQLGRLLSDESLTVKLPLANEFKAFVKKNSVQPELIYTYFSTLSRAIDLREDPPLTSVCFSCFCHLFKRVSIQNKNLLGDSSLVEVITDQLISRLDDKSQNVRATANKVLQDYWVLCPQAIGVAMRQRAVVSTSHVTLSESLKWLDSILDISSDLNFSAFVEPVVDMLRFPQLQAKASELLIKVYSRRQDKFELEECLGMSSVSVSVKRGVLEGVHGVQTQRQGGVTQTQKQGETLKQGEIRKQRETRKQSETFKQGETLQQSVVTQNPPSSENQSPLHFLDSLQGYPIDHQIQPENVYSIHDLESKFNNMHAAFENKESEKNWTVREKHVIQIRKLLRGNGPTEHPHIFLACYKSVLDGILKSATSLRTTLSNQGLFLLKETGQICGHTFIDPFLDIVLPQIIRLTGQMKKITSTNAHITVCGILACASYSTKMVSHITAATQDKNANPRTFAATWLRIIIICHSQTHRANMQQYGTLEQLEKAVYKGLTDPTPSVKENMRITYWSFAEHWPGAAEKIISKLDPKARSLLERSNPERGGNVVKKSVQRESLKDLIRKTRESGGGVARDHNQRDQPPSRTTKMGAPQRTSSTTGLSGRSLSGSHVASSSTSSASSRSNSLRSQSRDPHRVASDSTFDRRSVSSMRSREPSLSRDRGRGEPLRSREPSLSREPVRSRESSLQRDFSRSRDPSFGRPRNSSISSRSSVLDDPYVDPPKESPKESPKETKTSPVEIPRRDSHRESYSTTPPSSSPFVVSKSPATQFFSSSTAEGISVSPVNSAESELVRDLSLRRESGSDLRRQSSDANGLGLPRESLVEVEVEVGKAEEDVVMESESERGDVQDGDSTKDDHMNEEVDMDMQVDTQDAVEEQQEEVERKNSLNASEVVPDEEAAPVEVDAVSEAAPVEVGGAPMDVDPVPVEVDPASDEVGPTPAEVNPAPIEVNPAPIEVNPAPVEVDAAPHQQESDGMMNEQGAEQEAEEAPQDGPTTQHNMEDADFPVPDVSDSPANDTHFAESHEAMSVEKFHDESEPMEMCMSDNEENQLLDISSIDLKEAFNTYSAQDLSQLLSNQQMYEKIMDQVPTELFLLCVILYAEDNVNHAKKILLRDPNLALSTASSMVMVCARDVYPGESRWSRASTEQLQHVTLTCLEWLKQMSSETESRDTAIVLATHKRYRTSLVHLLSTSVNLHKQKFGDVTHTQLINVIESMDQLGSRPPDKQTSRAFKEAPSPPHESVDEMTNQLSHVSVKEEAKETKTIRVQPAQLAAGHSTSALPTGPHFAQSHVTWSQLELERLRRSVQCSDSTDSILEAVSRDKVSLTQLSTLGSRVPKIEDSELLDNVTATILAFLHGRHPPAVTSQALVVIKQVLVKKKVQLSMAHVTEIYSTLNNVNQYVDARAPLAAAIEELVADLLVHADSSEMMEFLLQSRSPDSQAANHLLLLNSHYHIVTAENILRHQTDLLTMISELISASDPLVRRVTVGLVVRILRLCPEIEPSVANKIKSKMDLVRYYMGK